MLFKKKNIFLKVSMKKDANILFRLFCKIKNLFSAKRKSIFEIPVIINNFNRLTYLRNLIVWLEKAGMNNIYIIDNLSTYPPLLEFYQKTKYTVFRLDKNLGHDALWKTHLQMLFCKNYYIYTDPDILPLNECPVDFINHFYKILEDNPHYDKVGFGLKIDDLPDFYEHKFKVIEWESQYWTNKIGVNLYHANIDTTFALYRPNTYDQRWDKAIRTDFPYLARHLPWYLDKNNLNEEESYYRNNASGVSSWNESKLRY
jgi:hypothetical protein